MVATLLPIASFYLKLGRFAPARMLIDARRRRRARDRRQSRRRLLAVDAVRDDARLLRHGPDVRGGAGRARRSTPPARSIARTASAASSRASRWTRSSSTGPAINLIRVGADTIRAVVKRGRSSSVTEDTEETRSQEKQRNGDERSGVRPARKRATRKKPRTQTAMIGLRAWLLPRDVAASRRPHSVRLCYSVLCVIRFSVTSVPGPHVTDRSPSGSADRVQLHRSDAGRRIGVGARVGGRRVAADDGRGAAEDAQRIGRGSCGADGGGRRAGRPPRRR